MNNSRNTKGFTILELLVVLAIVAVLAAALAPAMFDANLQSKIDRTNQYVVELIKAAQKARPNGIYTGIDFDEVEDFLPEGASATSLFNTTIAVAVVSGDPTKFTVTVPVDDEKTRTRMATPFQGIQVVSNATSVVYTGS